MKVEKRFNDWTLFMFVDTVEKAQHVIAEQYKVTNAYEFRIVE